jgi:hypothetical protein
MGVGRVALNATAVKPARPPSVEAKTAERPRQPYRKPAEVG